jgi:hypothetical protein
MVWYVIGTNYAKQTVFNALHIYKSRENIYLR